MVKYVIFKCSTIELPTARTCKNDHRHSAAAAIKYIFSIVLFHELYAFFFTVVVFKAQLTPAVRLIWNIKI